MALTTERAPVASDTNRLENNSVPLVRRVTRDRVLQQRRSARATNRRACFVNYAVTRPVRFIAIPFRLSFPRRKSKGAPQFSDNGWLGGLCERYTCDRDGYALRSIQVPGRPSVGLKTRRFVSKWRTRARTLRIGKQHARTTRNDDDGKRLLFTNNGHVFGDGHTRGCCVSARRRRRYDKTKTNVRTLWNNSPLRVSAFT